MLKLFFLFIIERIGIPYAFKTMAKAYTYDLGITLAMPQASGPLGGEKFLPRERES